MKHFKKWYKKNENRWWCWECAYAEEAAEEAYGEALRWVLQRESKIDYSKISSYDEALNELLGAIKEELEEL